MYFLQLFKYIICFKKQTMVYKAIFQLFLLPINKGNNCVAPFLKWNVRPQYKKTSKKKLLIIFF